MPSKTSPLINDGVPVNIYLTYILLEVGNSGCQDNMLYIMQWCLKFLIIQYVVCVRLVPLFV